MFDLAVIGGGPAGVAAGVYAARKRLRTVLITESVGGQSVDSTEIQNWIGTPRIAGLELAKNLESHLRAYANDVVDIQIGKRVLSINRNGAGFSVRTTEGSYDTRAVLVATGGVRRKLEIPGAVEFENKGVTYCASCDGPLFSGQDVAVIGGGNAGFESASQLLSYCKTVTLVHRQAEFTRADKATVMATLAHPNMRTLVESVPTEIHGEKFVKNMTVRNIRTEEITVLPVTGIFVEIGAIPATNFVKGLVDMNDLGNILVDAKNQRTSCSGVWAAGDCSDGLYHQNNIAAGDAVKALEDIFYFLHKR